MSALLNDNDVALQAAPYRDKTTLVTVTTTATNFITTKNGGTTTPTSITLTAVPNIVFTAAATFVWSYALNTAPTTWKAFDGALISGTTTFAGAGTSAPKVGTYTNIVQLSTSGTGTGAKFVITKLNTTTSYTGVSVTVVNPGVGYKVGDTITISGGFLGGTVGTNNLVLTIGGSVTSETGTSTKVITAETANSLVGTTRATSIQFRAEVSENFLDTAYGYAVVSYSLEQANSDSVSIELTRTNAAVNTSISGVPSNFNNTGTTITVIRANTQLVYSSGGGDSVAVSVPNSFHVAIVTDTGLDATVANRTVGSVSTTATSWSLSGITALTANFATVTFLITIYDASGYKSQSTYKTLSLNKVASGVNGEPAVVYYVELSAPIITKSTSSKFIDGTHAQINITGKRTIGSGVEETYGYLTVTGDLETESATGILATNLGYTTNILNTSQNSIYTIKLYNMADRTDAAAVLLDTQVVPVVFNGANGVVATITNDSSTIPVTIAGTPISGGYANTGTAVRVYEGSEELTYDSVGTANGTYTVTTSALNVTVGTISKISGTIYATAGNVSNINGDTASITFNISGKSKGGTVFTISKIQTIAKAYPGTDAQLYYLELSAPVISKDAPSASADGPHSTITITGRQTIGNALPTTTGFLTFAATLGVTGSSSNSIALTGVASLVVNAPVIFSGTGIPSGINIGTTYFVKTIDTNSKTITISATAGGTTLTIANSSGLTSVFVQSEPTTATANFIVTSLTNDIGAISFTARMYTTANKATLLDSAILPIIFKGSNAVTMVLTNDSSVVPCDSTSTPISGAFTNTGTGIRVFDGVDELTYDGAGTANGTYTVTASGSSITPGAISLSGINAVASQASNIIAAVASIVFTVTGRTKNGALISLSKSQSISKSVNGAKGADGTNYKTAVITAFGWSNSSTPPSLVGTFNYNWAGAGSLSLGSGMSTIYPTGYYETAPASTANNQTLHQITVNITDVSTATVTANIAWSTAKANKLGYREDGSIGFTGDAARTCYIVTTSASPPGIPTAGIGDVVPTSPDGTWSFASTGSLSPGQFMYQSDGTFKGSTNTTTWRAPYLSNLKVGSLSALSANLGYITAGAINIGPDKFTVDTNGNVKIKGSGTGRLEITNEAVKVYDGTGALRVQLGNLDV